MKDNREYDFALIIGNLELKAATEDALFTVGCDDATFSLRHGLVYGEFSRRAGSLQAAVLSAIRDVRRACPASRVLRVDESDLVSAAEIARRIGRTRQLIHQYMTGVRGPGGFPPPECQLSDRAPVWTWCAVSQWLAQNDILKPEDARNAEVIAAINNRLEMDRQRARHPELVQTIECELSAVRRTARRPVPSRRNGPEKKSSRRIRRLIPTEAGGAICKGRDFAGVK